MPDPNPNPNPTEFTDLTSETDQQALINLRPTLFIGIGGTGMEVLLRTRRRILNTLWGNSGSKERIENLTEFPVAQFIHFDLDNSAIIDSGKAQAEDLQFDSVKFTKDEKIVEKFDLKSYCSEDDVLEKYPHIKEWLPITPEKIRKLSIDASKGAGQIRAISRLYFFDKYTDVRDKIRLKLKALQSAGLSNQKQLTKLGLQMEANRFRIVVVCSVAGGTGSGAFLDMGWLARWLADSSTDVELMLFLPTGYSGANKQKTEANGYAALMELEAAMRGNKAYVGQWDGYDKPSLDFTPYSEVYLIDSGNIAQQHTNNIQDIYHMLADTLFEDFISGDFANKKRSVAVNQKQHKLLSYNALLPKNKFGDMKLTYSKSYSSLGQSVLDTRQEAKRDIRAHLLATQMLKAFFGVGSDDIKANRATNEQRDTFLKNYVGLDEYQFNDFPDFSDKSIKLEYSNGEFTDYAIVKELLNDVNGSLLSNITEQVNQKIITIKNAPREERANQVRLALKEMETDVIRNHNSKADTVEDRITKVRRELLNKYKTGIKNTLYDYLDIKDIGGLEYVETLVDQIKNKIDLRSDGLVAKLQANAKRYREIKDSVKTREFEFLIKNLEQTYGFDFLSKKETESQLILDHLSKAIKYSLTFHLLEKAANEAATYLEDLSTWLGNNTGVDSHGEVVWSGLMGEFIAGRNAVINMIKTIDRSNAILQSDINKEHATLIYIQTPEFQILPPSAAEMREWATAAFDDFGGSKEIFQLLKDPAKKGQIISKVKKMAERQLVNLPQFTDNISHKDPLIESLKEMSSNKRIELFKKWIACSMPWVDAIFTNDFKPVSDQYKCFIGVSNDKEFTDLFGEELNACTPNMALSIVTMGVTGRAVCYTELSGLPLTVLTGIEEWRTSYRKESEGIPLHTHIDSTQFSHPIAPSPNEISLLAKEFKYFILATMTGVLKRMPQKVIPRGQYVFRLKVGSQVRIGNERAIRQNGFPYSRKTIIIDRVEDILDNADGYRLLFLSALASYYESEVYKPKLDDAESGAQEISKGFASTMAGEVFLDLHSRIMKKKIFTEVQVNEIIEKLLEPDNLKLWAIPIENSDEDAFKYEVAPLEEDEEPRLKYSIKPEILNMDSASGIVQSVLSANVQNSFGQAQPIPISAVSSGFLLPSPSTVAVPPPQPSHQFFIFINGSQFGPYSTQQMIQMVQAGQVALTSKVWRQGLAAWVDLNTLPELTSLLSPTLTEPPPPPLMPPPVF